MKYSATTKSFYVPEFDYKILPADLIDVSRDDFDNAVAERAEGGSISFLNGVLVVVPVPPQLRIARITTATVIP